MSFTNVFSRSVVCLFVLSCMDVRGESTLDCEEIQPVNPRGNQSWIFIERADAEAETPIHWPPYAKNWLSGKDPDAGKDWRQEEKGTTEDEMVGWHHRLNEFKQAPGVGDGQGNLACCKSMGSQRVRHDWVTELNTHVQTWWQYPAFHLEGSNAGAGGAAAGPQSGLGYVLGPSWQAGQSTRQFSICVLCVGTGTVKSVCMLFRSWTSVSSSLPVSLTCFQTSYGGLSSLSQMLRLECLIWASNPLLLREAPQACYMPLLCWVTH